MEGNLSDSETRSPKWAQVKRLEYIDFRLFWDGRFNRSELAAAFGGMSTQQASADIAEYQKAAPSNLTYDTAAKAYVRGSDYQPAFTASVDRYLLQLVALESEWMDPGDTWFVGRPPVEVVSMRRPAHNPTHLLAVLDAIRLKQEIDVDYRSMTGSPADWRRIAPHAMAYCAGRWYARAWSRDHNDFRDYSLRRIRAVREPSPADVDYNLDYEWHQIFDLILTANPALSPESRRAVEEENGIGADGRRPVPVRLSLSFYLMVENCLDIKPGVLAAERQQLVLENREDVEAARHFARETSRQALARMRAQTPAATR